MSETKKLPVPETREDFEEAIRGGADNLPALIRAYRAGSMGALSQLIHQLDEDSVKWTLMASIGGASGLLDQLPTGDDDDSWASQVGPALH